MFDHVITMTLRTPEKVQHEDLMVAIKSAFSSMEIMYDQIVIDTRTPQDAMKIVLEADHGIKIEKGAYSIYHDKFNDMPSLLNAETPDTIITQSDLRKLINQFIELSNFGEQPITPEYVQQKMQAASRLLKESDWEAADTIIKHTTKELLLSIKHGRCTNVQECIKQLGY